jgi:hypothetical protein
MLISKLKTENIENISSAHTYTWKEFQVYKMEISVFCVTILDSRKKEH